MRIWVKLWKDNHMLRDTTITDNGNDTRTHKIFRALETACHEFDLAQPLWLDASVKEFQRHARVRFGQDSFIEEIPFDHMEFQVIEED